MPRCEDESRVPSVDLITDSSIKTSAGMQTDLNLNDSKVRQAFILHIFLVIDVNPESISIRRVRNALESWLVVHRDISDYIDATALLIFFVGEYSQC
jgi:hypothetical protein